MKPGRRIAAVRWWLLVLLAYTAGTLAWLGRVGTGGASELPVRPGSALLPSVPLSPARSRAIVAGPDREDPARVVFRIPFAVEELERAEQYRFALRPMRDAEPFTIQVIAECDHHFSYSRVYPKVTLSGAGFSFTVPLTGDGAASYWRPVDHPGQWTAWERSGLRRLEIKVFARSAIRRRMVLQYRPAPADGPTQGRLAWAHVPVARLPLGERFELAFDLAGWDGNPFDCRALPVALEVSPPAAAPRRILPFLHQNFQTVAGLDRERIRPCGPKHFLARYRPGVAGQHSYRLLFRETDGRERVLEAGGFVVTDGTPPDFLRVSARGPHFFEHADGRFFYPIGWNIPYPTDRPYGQDYVPYLPDEQSLAFTRKLFDDLADAGGNFTRFWLSDWWNGLEWNKAVDNYGGIGRYNLKNAWLNDRILAHCERRGIRLQWETRTHSSLKHDYGWPQHPYNTANGGFLRDINAFWSHPRTRALSRNHLAYIVARYADSPAIHSWNVMSEPDILGRTTWPQAKIHILSQLRFIRRLDPYGHIIGNQLCMSDRDPGFFLEKEVQFVSANAYAGGIAGLPQDQIPAIRGFSERYSGHARPMLVAETAGHFAGDPAFKMRRDTLGALWSGVAAGLAGTPLSWWWNFNYGEDLGGWYRVVADFMRGEDLIREDTPDKGGWRNRDAACANRTGNLRALMAGNTTRRFLFVYNFDTLSRTRGVPTRCVANRVTFGGMTPGDYVAEYWDLHAGRTAELQELRIGRDGAGALNPPEFTAGWAIKIRPRQASDGKTPDRDTAAEQHAPTTLSPAPLKTPGEAAGDWSWRILPRAGVVFAAAAERSVVEARIGLPEACRRRRPHVTDAAGRPVPFSWQFLDAAAGWRILVRATQAGPLTVTAAAEAPLAQPPLDEESWGLLVTVAPVPFSPSFAPSPFRSRPARNTRGFSALQTVPMFERRFETLPDKRQARMGVIDQVENPLGDSLSFLAVYRGPLLAPADGDYVFASNSDDGSFVKIDGEVVVSWPGGHDMDELNRPAVNTWEHRGTVGLNRGLHWVEYYHQQDGGAALARLGWRPPEADHADAALIAQPFREAKPAAAIDTVPAWALDGRIPCAVELRYKGRVQLTLAPCLGLELRRPRTHISVAALEDGQRRRYEFFRGEGLQWVRSGGRKVPLWAWNVARRAFSLEWETCTDGTDQPLLKTLVYDMALPLSVQVGNRPLGEQAHAARRWTAWPLAERDQRAAFTIGLGSIPLLRGALGRWSGMPDRPVPAAQTTIALGRLLELGITETGAPLPGGRLAPWWRGAPPDNITPARLRLDPWTGDPAELAAALGRQRSDTGVLLRLDRGVLLLGLSADQVYRHLHAVLRAIGRANAVPVLVLNPEIDLARPREQALALAFHSLSVDFACPFVDLRERAP